MLKQCLNCGLTFEGSPQAKFHSNACRVAYSRRELAHSEEVAQAELAQNGEVAQHSRTRTAPKTVMTAEEVAAGRTVHELISYGRAGGTLSAEEEQRIREYFGYAPSESRTLAERDATARRIVENTGGPKSLSSLAFPFVVGRKPERWSLRPDPAKLDALHRK